MTQRNCDNCGVGYGPDDMFCENCGYDFITGSLPPDGEMAVPAVPGVPSGAPSPSSVSGAAPSVLESAAGEAPEVPSVPTTDQEVAAVPDASGSEEELDGDQLDVPRLKITVAIDRPYFDAVVNDGELDFPDPVPADIELELAGAELHIGRTSESRAIHPDIDVAELTGDQAVSSRHAVLRVSTEGAYTIVDVGSTNGTFVETPDSEAITQGVPFEIKAGAPIYVGAWTSLTITA